MRQFLYISKTKVDVLEAGLSWRRRRMPEVTATVSTPVGVQVGVKPPPARDLYKRTDALIRKMERRKFIVPMPEQDKLTTGVFYHDESVWANGLFSFKGDFALGGDEARVVSYLLWRRWHDSIILLAGSPENVLGEKIVRDGVWAYGTTGTWATIFHFAETNLRSDEPTLVGVTSASTHPEAGDVPWLDWDAGHLNDGENSVPHELLASPRALALGVLCLRYLTTLPTGSIDTTFRISERPTVTPRGGLPRWVVELFTEGGAPRERIAFLRQCRTVYVGSPLYTALA